MKNIFLAVFYVALFSVASNAFAQDNDLCIGLLNRSEGTVSFIGSGDPGGDIPKANPEQIRVLRGDYWVGCYDNSCWAMVMPGNSIYNTTIYDIPRGTLIGYYGPNNYKLEKDAGIKCIWGS